MKKSKAKPKKKRKGKEEKSESKLKKAERPSGDSEFSYDVTTDHVTVKVRIMKKPEESIHTYILELPQLETATLAFLDDLKKWCLVLFLEKLPEDRRKFMTGAKVDGTFKMQDSSGR